MSDLLQNGSLWTLWSSRVQLGAAEKTCFLIIKSEWRSAYQTMAYHRWPTDLSWDWGGHGFPNGVNKYHLYVTGTLKYSLLAYKSASVHLMFKYGFYCNHRDRISKFWWGM